MTEFPKPKTYKSKKYLAFIRRHPCFVCGRKAEPHHVSLGESGVGMKASDTHCIPLCRECHNVIHTSSFFGYDLKKIIIGLLTEYIREMETK